LVLAYIAIRDLNCSFGRIKAGELVPHTNDIKIWHPTALQSNIEIGWIKQVPDEEIVAAPEPKRKRTKKGS
jgi:hypothetical protein